jgi:hypothetical protein
MGSGGDHLQVGCSLSRSEDTSTSTFHFGHTLSYSSWVNAINEELENFERNYVWTLVEPPRNVNVIGTKWVFKTKQGGMVRL